MSRLQIGTRKMKRQLEDLTGRVETLEEVIRGYERNLRPFRDGGRYRSGRPCVRGCGAFGDVGGDC